MNGFAYLLKLSPENNNNRYYRMVAQPDGNSFLVEMGRVGARPVTMKRPMALWNTTLERKLKDGYIDRTDSCSVDIGIESEYAPIPDPEVRSLVSSLLTYADKEIEESYSVSYTEVSEEMLEKAQELLGIAAGKESVEEFNKILEELFVVIPRKMKDVKSMLARSEEDMVPMIQREQELLDVMAAKVSRSSISRRCGNRTILEDWGVEIRPCTDKENRQIIRHLTSESSGHFRRAFRVRNKETDERFWDYVEKNGLSKSDIHYLYHGSPNSNYVGLVSQGQKLNPKAPIAGKMFGRGLYYAPRAKKSINYTSICDRWRSFGLADTGYLAVCKVAYKKPKDVYSHEYSYTHLDKHSIHPYDALYAHADGGVRFLYNDEIIVYDESQTTMQYLIEIKK